LRLPRLLAGGAVLAVVAGTAACGAQALEPKLALRDALSDFTAGRTGALELSVASSGDDVRAFSEAAGPSSTGALADDALDSLLTSSFEVGYDLGDDRKDDADDRTSIVVRLGDLTAGELRMVDGLVYARADVEGLAKKFPEIRDGLDEFRAGLTGDDGGSEAASAEVVGPATALIDGAWVVVDPQGYLDQLEELAGPDGGSAGMSLPDYASPEARDLLGSAMKDAVTSVERREDDEELGDHLVAGLDLGKGYTTLRAGLPGLFEGEMAAQLEKDLPPVAEVPDKQIDVSFWVKDGNLTRVELDVAQFLADPAGHLVLRADTHPVEEITAPSDAVEFDIAAITESAMSYAAAEGGTALGGGTELDAHTVALWVDQDIAGAAREGGWQPSVSQLADVLPLYEGVVAGLIITAVGDRVQVNIDEDVVCLTPSPDGMGEHVVPGGC
jgi:hypothetical protein